MANKKILGIIGGAGVAATNKFNELLEQKLTKDGAYRDQHHPQIISYQATQAPSRSMYLEGRGDDFSLDYIEVGKALKNAGATTLCMTCNTAHYFIDEISLEIGLPFINLIEKVIERVKKENKINVGLIVSDGTIRGKVYEKYFKLIYPKANIIYPDEEMQKNTTKGIVNIKNRSRFLDIDNPDRPNYIFKEVSNHLYKNGADIIISGCTDIRVDFCADDFRKCKIVDSLDVLVDTVVNTFTGDKKENSRDMFYNKLAKTITKDTDTRFLSKETGDLDADFVKKYSDSSKYLLDLGAGTGLMINKIYDYFNHITAVEKYKEFSKFIKPKNNLQIINADLLEWSFPVEKFDIVTSFGVMHYFKREEAKLIYKKTFYTLKKNGIFIIKNQFGLSEDVIIDGFSTELQTNYFAEYRQIDKEIKLLKDIGFSVVDVVDIYPQEYNRWDNTHFYALLCRK